MICADHNVFLNELLAVIYYTSKTTEINVLVFYSSLDY